MQTPPRLMLHLVLAGASMLLAACSSSQSAATDPSSTRNQPTIEQPTIEAPRAPVAPTSEPTPSPWLQPPAVADDPALIAEQLSNAELAIRDAAVSGPELAWKAQLQQKVYRRLLERPDIQQAVISRLPDAVRPAAQRNLD